MVFDEIFEIGIWIRSNTFRKCQTLVTGIEGKFPIGYHAPRKLKRLNLRPLSDDEEFLKVNKRTKLIISFYLKFNDKIKLEKIYLKLKLNKLEYFKHN